MMRDGWRKGEFGDDGEADLGVEVFKVDSVRVRLTEEVDELGDDAEA